LGIIVLTGISLLYSFAVQNTVLGGESENQNSLIKGLKEGGLGVKVTTLVLLALFTILIAPLMEELAARQA
jgi:membrane protease YdiL (CAAX protease family)